MLETLNDLERDGLASLEAAEGADAVEAWRIEYLGTKGKVKAALAGMKDVSKEDRPAFGKRSNEVKQALEAAFEAKKTGGNGSATASAGRGRGPQVDVTEPGMPLVGGLGRRHILMRVRDDLVDVFARMGFDVAEGPELEDEEHNFIKLNIPAEHPARDPSDNFYLSDENDEVGEAMLRSQTSTVQIRVLEQMVAEGLEPPVRVVSPGRVYRPDTVDATHSFMFHQLEGLYVDEGVSMADLKSTLLHFVRAYFGEGSEIRLRPSYFPFTEPSAEFDMKITLREDRGPEWVELGGCGMVDPAVLTACGLDPERWSGFAFGFGIERIAMGRYAIPDIRMLFENDVGFLAKV